MLSDEEVVRFALGDCFLHFEKDQAEERLESTTNEAQADVKKIEAEISDLKDQLKVLLGLPAYMHGFQLVA
jgi:prefoldin subunit 4